MKLMAAMLSAVFPRGMRWACHGGSHGGGHRSRLFTFQGSSHDQGLRDTNSQGIGYDNDNL